MFRMYCVSGRHTHDSPVARSAIPTSTSLSSGRFVGNLLERSPFAWYHDSYRLRSVGSLPAQTAASHGIGGDDLKKRSRVQAFPGDSVREHRVRELPTVVVGSHEVLSGQPSERLAAVRALTRARGELCRDKVIVPLAPVYRPSYIG